MDNPVKQLGLRVAEYRQARGFSQREFAELAEISQPTLSSIENGYTATNVDILVKIARVLRIPLVELFRFGEPAPTSNIPGEIREVLESFTREEWAALMPTIRGILIEKEASSTPQKQQKLRKPRG